MNTEVKQEVNELKEDLNEDAKNNYGNNKLINILHSAIINLVEKQGLEVLSYHSGTMNGCFQQNLTIGSDTKYPYQIMIEYKAFNQGVDSKFAFQINPKTADTLNKISKNIQQFCTFFNNNKSKQLTEQLLNTLIIQNFDDCLCVVDFDDSEDYFSVEINNNKQKQKLTVSIY